MKETFKRFFALMLIMIILFSGIPGIHAEEILEHTHSSECEHEESDDTSQYIDNGFSEVAENPEENPEESDDTFGVSNDNDNLKHEIYDSYFSEEREFIHESVASFQGWKYMQDDYHRIFRVPYRFDDRGVLITDEELREIVYEGPA